MSAHLGPASWEGDRFEGFPFSGYITDRYGTWGDTRKALGLGPHIGLDVAAEVGTPIRSPGHGVIKGSGLGHADGSISALGYYTIVDYGNVGMLFAHLREPTSLPDGSRVRRGDLLGHVGMTGLTTGPHCHIMASKKKLPNGWFDFSRASDATVNPLDVLSSSSSLFLPEPAWKGTTLTTLTRNVAKADLKFVPFIKSIWIYIDGEPVGFTPGAPDFVNKKFPERIMSGNAVLVTAD